MAAALTLNKSITINASKAKVWEALTNPDIIKQYFFGTLCISDWKKGSTIKFSGVYEGKPYEDKGNILDIEKEKFIQYNYWSNFSGTEDIPENYATIKYELTPHNHETILMVTQDGFKSQETLNHSMTNWDYVLGEMKKLLEA